MKSLSSHVQESLITESQDKIKVNYYADSYQYAEPETYVSLEQAKKAADKKLSNDSKLDRRQETYWCTFTKNGERLDMFDERISYLSGKQNS